MIDNSVYYNQNNEIIVYMIKDTIYILDGTRAHKFFVDNGYKLVPFDKWYNAPGSCGDPYCDCCPKGSWEKAYYVDDDRFTSGKVFHKFLVDNGLKLK